MASHVREGEPSQSLLLGFIDRIGWMARVVRRAGLDLDKDDRAAIDGHQIDFTDVVAMAPSHDHIAQPA
jgi:hypothetical protein